MKKEDRQKEYRKKLAIIDACRTYLYFKCIITDNENETIFKRIKKYQYKHKIEISREQLDSVDFTYND